MVVTFVGFVGGYVKAVFGPDSLFLAGAVAATLVTWFTFLPSFIFILMGGPFIETTHNDLKFTAPLTAITAAVVGVILNLALFFGYHVLWPNGFSGSFEWGSASSLWLLQLRLFRFKVNVIHVIGACAVMSKQERDFLPPTVFFRFMHDALLQHLLRGLADDRQPLGCGPPRPLRAFLLPTRDRRATMRVPRNVAGAS
jgi:hypothetical protein